MKQTYVVFAGDFERRAHAASHLFKEIAKKHRVIWVETSGLRNPSLNIKDLKRVIEKTSRLLKKKKTRQTSGIEVRRVFTIPWNDRPLIQKINQKRVFEQLVDIENATFVTIFPTHAPYASLPNFIKKVYYCVDDFGSWSGYSKEVLDKQESKLLDIVDLTLATSEWLVQNKTKATYFSHGVDLEKFTLPKKTHTSKELCLFGLIDERIDVEFLYVLMKKLPDYRLKLIGEITVDISALKTLPNVEILGRVPYENLKNKIANTDCFLLPYKKNELTLTIEPLKIREYLATGRNVLSTDFTDFGNLKDSINISNSVSEWINIIQNGSGLKTQASLESWEEKADEFCRLTTSNIQNNQKKSLF